MIQKLSLTAKDTGDTVDPIQPTRSPSSQDLAPQNGKALIRIVVEAVIMICCIAVVPFVVYVDAVVFGFANTEESIAEHFHNGLLFVVCLMFAIGAVKYPMLRGYLVMVVTLFACLFIRELDFLFDHVWHGFWVYPALAILIVGTIFVRRNKTTVLRPMLQHYETRSGTIMYVGFFLLIVFTRLFGTSELWKPVMGADYDAALKGIIQEGTELLAYMLIAYGACLALLTSFGEGVDAKD
jgi:hypothetical protein